MSVASEIRPVHGLGYVMPNSKSSKKGMANVARAGKAAKAAAARGASSADAAPPNAGEVQRVSVPPSGYRVIGGDRGKPEQAPLSVFPAGGGANAAQAKEVKRLVAQATGETSDSRGESDDFPWWKIGVGVAVTAAGVGVIWWMRRRSGRA